MIFDCQTVAPIGNSDHAVLFKVMLPNNVTYSEQSGTTYQYDFKRADYACLNIF